MTRPLTVLACLLAFCGPAAFAQAPEGGGSGPEMNSGICSACGKEATWTGGSANAPKRCPHCRVRISTVSNDDGTETNLNSGRTRTRTPTWVKVLIAVAVLVALAVGGLVKVMREERATRNGTRSKMGRAARERRRESEAEATPRRRPPPPDDDDAPIKMADDNGGFEVIGDAPAPAAEPPRRAKPKLLPPDGGPRGN